MDNRKQLFHHAYCLIGNDSTNLELIFILANNYSIKVQGNPDFFDRKYDTFTIDDAREIKSLHTTKPINALGKKIFILRMNGVTVEAQNALLKLLEEPNEDAHFFLIISSAHLLLPTIKSRVSIIDLKELSGDKKNKNNVSQKNFATDPIFQDAEKFVSMSASRRLEFLKKLVDDIKNEKKSKQDAIDLLDSIQTVVYQENGIKQSPKSLEAIELARKYIHDRAPSIKMLLEYVALNI